MTLVVDASAMVAMLLDEPEKDRLADQLDQDRDRIWTAIARWETVVNIARVRKYGFRQAEAEVDELASKLDIQIVPLNEIESRLAIQAFESYGKGAGNPAQLNMGDCFAYACAKANNARLLYKGNDFTHTDLA